MTVSLSDPNLALPTGSDDRFLLYLQAVSGLPLSKVCRPPPCTYRVLLSGRVVREALSNTVAIHVVCGHCSTLSLSVQQITMINVRMKFVLRTLAQ